jgi:hypothetical protein
MGTPNSGGSTPLNTNRMAQGYSQNPSTPGMPGIGFTPQTNPQPQGPGAVGYGDPGAAYNHTMAGPVPGSLDPAIMAAQTKAENSYGGFSPGPAPTFGPQAVTGPGIARTAQSFGQPQSIQNTMQKPWAQQLMGAYQNNGQVTPAMQGIMAKHGLGQPAPMPYPFTNGPTGLPPAFGATAGGNMTPDRAQFGATTGGNMFDGGPGQVFTGGPGPDPYGAQPPFNPYPPTAMPAPPRLPPYFNPTGAPVSPGNNPISLYPNPFTFQTS